MTYINKNGRVAFVTGANGFIGSNLVKRLVKEGYFVKALVRAPNRADTLKDLPNVELIIGDITNELTYNYALKGTDIVYNTAGVVTDWAPKKQYYDVHVLGLRKLLDAAVANKVRRFIHISTVAVLEKNMRDIPVKDDSPFTKSKNYYDDSKLKGERLALQYALEKKIEVIAIRPAWVYGRGDTTLMPEIAYQTKKGSMVLVHNDHVFLPLVHVENLCDALILAASKDGVNGEAFLISDGEITWKELSDRIAEAVKGKKPTLIIPYKLAYAAGAIMETLGKLLGSKNRPLLTRTAAEMVGVSIIIDANKIRDQLGYIPKVSLVDGMRDVLQWLSSSELNEIRKK